MKAHKRKIIILAVCIVAVAFIASFVLVQVKDRTYFHQTRSCFLSKEWRTTIRGIP